VKSGAWAGLVWTAALVAVSFLGWKTVGLPFAPFDIFDWIVRLLPGGVVTFAIEASVAISRVFGVTNIGAAAKAGDQILAIAGLLATGTAAGAVLFALLSTSDEPALLFGAVLGVMLGGLALIAERRLGRLPPDSIAPAVWVGTTFLAWGCGIGEAFDRARAGHFSAGRRLLITSACMIVVGVIAGRRKLAVIGTRWSDGHALPNAASPVKPVAGTRAEFTPIEDFYRIDTNTRAPSIDREKWRLAIGGLVDRQRAIALSTIYALEPTHVFATLSCISNPPGGDLISTTLWSGVSLASLLPVLHLQPSATHLKFTSADGFFEVVSLDTARADERVMLAYAWDGVPLPVEHGFPLRLYVPDLYGMKQPKWVVGMEAISQWEPGYWVQRGWDRDGRVVPAATVDTVVRHPDSADVGGIAYAGSRGVENVEVQVDGGEWRTAQLRAPLSELSWVIWRATLPLGKRYAARVVVSSRA
jgi:DMSO/TMAO reductase YedYZ molybdopterin-dependent catalytic subunit